MKIDFDTERISIGQRFKTVPKLFCLNLHFKNGCLEKVAFRKTFLLIETFTLFEKTLHIGREKKKWERRKTCDEDILDTFWKNIQYELDNVNIFNFETRSGRWSPSNFKNLKHNCANKSHFKWPLVRADRYWTFIMDEHR